MWFEGFRAKPPPNRDFFMIFFKFFQKAVDIGKNIAIIPLIPAVWRARGLRERSPAHGIRRNAAIMLTPPRRFAGGQRALGGNP